MVSPSVSIAYPKNTPRCAVVTMTARSLWPFVGFAFFLVMVSPRSKRHPPGPGSRLLRAVRRVKARPHVRGLMVESGMRLALATGLMLPVALLRGGRPLAHGHERLG